MSTTIAGGRLQGVIADVPKPRSSIKEYFMTLVGRKKKKNRSAEDVSHLTERERAEMGIKEDTRNAEKRKIMISQSLLVRV